MVIIVHRLPAIKEYDKIFVVDNEKIVDSTTHDYVINNYKEYIELYNMNKKRSIFKNISFNFCL